ncbi:MAG: 5'-methylthioadenosine/adenosylhomocysteine nucleosidase [Clostridia bacterium]|nr:5'-methylthioadenosine/adenosylhomocysteine nucleosidase [Clostridia bacterium]
MGDYKTIGILSALEVESDIILKKMTDTEVSVIAGMTFTRGTIQGKTAVLATCGVSKVNAALFTQIMIDHFSPDCILFTGVAGSMDPSVRQMDLVVADRLTFHDVNPHQLEFCFPNQVWFRSDVELTDLIRRNARGSKSGAIITGDQFITSRDQKRQLKKRFPEALAVEMEGCAVAQTCYVNQVPFAVIRCISDLADNKAEDSYDAFEKKAAEKSAGVILKTISDMQ